jgi:hypothetical protein
MVMACAVSLSPPGSTMVRYSCDLTGATTQIVGAFGAGNHVDACCPSEAGAPPAALAGEDCCRATVFSLPPTSPAPGQPFMTVSPTQLSLAPMAPTTGRLLTSRDARMIHVSLARNLPLLV